MTRRLRLLVLLLVAVLAGMLAQSAAAQTIVPGGPPAIVTTTSPGESASVFFDAVAGQRVSLEITDVTIGTSTTFECRLDGGAWAACASPETVTGLVPGAHVFEVRAVDPAGNADAAPAAYAWTVT
jgi:hypothetical protein